MSASEIEWTDDTWNPVLGCDRASPGCDGCYAITSAHIRAGNPHPAIREAYAGLTERRDGRIDWTGRINALPDRLDQPLRWRKQRRIFVNSMSDLFHEQVPDEFVARVFAVMTLAQQHTFQLLTKRHGRMRSLLRRDEFRAQVARLAVEMAEASPGPPYLPEHLVMTHGRPWWPLPNVWVGVSAENQRWANIRIPALMETPAAVRWVSAEPLLGPLDLARWLVPDVSVCQTDGAPETLRAVAQLARMVAGQHGWAGLDWVVSGGESGPKARPAHPDWFRHLRDQCAASGVPFLFKQHGAWAPVGPLYGDTDEVDEAHMEAVHLEVDERRTVVQLERSGHVADGYQPTDPRTWLMARVGKKAAGRELDGQVWDQYPESAVAWKAAP